MNLRPSRNLKVEEAVAFALDRVDAFLSGEEVLLPQADIRRACDHLIENQRASVITACLFLLCYKVVEPAYDFKTLPTGARGKFGDKRLCEELSKRSLTLHNNITAYFENIGAKGNVASFDLSQNPRTKAFVAAVAALPSDELAKAAGYLCYRFAESQRLIQPLPPVGAEVLTFARAKLLFHQLIALPSEGFVQQFLIAALLVEFRRNEEVEVFTHHPHASDTFDQAAGDIEEKAAGQLVRAYEVTVRDDWKNRLSDFKLKMDRHNLSKYTIIASKVRSDSQWYEPANLALALDSYGRDIAVLDREEFVNFMAAELAPKELRQAVNHVYKYLSNPSLCGRHDLMDKYREAVSQWLDQAASA